MKFVDKLESDKSGVTLHSSTHERTGTCTHVLYVFVPQTHAKTYA